MSFKYLSKFIFVVRINQVLEGSRRKGCFMSLGVVSSAPLEKVILFFLGVLYVLPFSNFKFFHLQVIPNFFDIGVDWNLQLCIGICRVGFKSPSKV